MYFLLYCSEAHQVWKIGKLEGVETPQNNWNIVAGTGRVRGQRSGWGQVSGGQVVRVSGGLGVMGSGVQRVRGQWSGSWSGVGFRVSVQFTYILYLGEKCTPGDLDLCGDGGPALQAKLTFPKGIAVSVDKTIYLTDGKRVRTIDQAGIITTLIGDKVREGVKIIYFLKTCPDNPRYHAMC